jgi:alanine dehydrogenase
MLIGVPKEIKQREYRVGMNPGAVREATAHGHRVLIETGAGAAIDCIAPPAPRSRPTRRPSMAPPKC